MEGRERLIPSRPKPSCEAQWRGRTTRQREKEVEGQHQGMDMPGARKVPQDSGEHRKMEETGCEVICCTPTTPSVKGLVKVTEGREVLVRFAGRTRSKRPRVASRPGMTTDGVNYGQSR